MTSTSKSDISIKRLTLKIIRAGMQTTVQDLGRVGYQDLGVPVGGSMDRRSAVRANRLVGNPVGAPLLEITLLGPAIEFLGDAIIAISGANLSPTINGEPISNNRSLSITSGSVLRFGKQISGCRGYLAIAGTIDVPTWLNSASASMPIAKKWTPGSVIAKDDRLNVLLPEPGAGSGIELEDENTQGNPDELVIVNASPGPEFHLFSEQELSQFFESTFTITQDSNRMGYRLSESVFVNAQKDDSTRAHGIISSGVFPGVVQIPSSGCPIVLMRDAQTSGGYPRIAVVHSKDLDRLAQLRPGDQFKFRR